jgi:hypothetical protein
MPALDEASAFRDLRCATAAIGDGAGTCYRAIMSMMKRDTGARCAALILQDRKRLPVRFLASLSGTALSRLR